MDGFKTYGNAYYYRKDSSGSPASQQPPSREAMIPPKIWIA